MNYRGIMHYRFHFSLYVNNILLNKTLLLKSKIVVLYNIPNYIKQILLTWNICDMTHLFEQHLIFLNSVLSTFRPMRLRYHYISVIEICSQNHITGFLSYFRRIRKCIKIIIGTFFTSVPQPPLPEC